MSKLYRAIHDDDDPQRAILYKKMKARKQTYLRSQFVQGHLAKDNYEELMDLIHMASITELDELDLPMLIKLNPGHKAVDVLKTKITVKEVPKRKIWTAGLKTRLPESLDHLTGLEKQERSSWISKTRRLYDKLIRMKLCTIEEKDQYDTNIHAIKSPIEAERIYLTLYLKHSDKYEKGQNTAYCSKCPHCLELKNLMEQAFNADVEDLERRETITDSIDQNSGEREL